MEIRLYLEATTPRNLGALIACMIANRTLSAEQLAEVVTPYLPNFAAETVTTGVKHEAVPRIPADMPTPEITALLADLNAELYSRRVITPEDNPAAGVELPAAAVAGMDDTMRAGDDLASIFGVASADPDALASHPEITLDKNGLPWDARIHAASKAINADGTWRQKRGVAPELVATVEAQLRGVMAVPVPDTHGSPELDEDAAKLESMGGDAGPTMGEILRDPEQQVAATRVVMPPPPPAAVVLPPPPPVITPPSTDPTTFPELVAYITAQKVAGKLTQTQLDAALVAIGVQGALPVMAARPDLIPTLVAKLRVLAGG